jgi:hypothetical protein
MKNKELFIFEGVEFVRKKCKCGTMFDSPVSSHRKRCRDCRLGKDVIDAMNKRKRP